ncbi:MAG: response regulator [Candidatus Nitrotoga sp.]
MEDEYIVARDIQQQLTDLGYDLVGHSTTGEQTIILAEELKPDLVLMDIQLAGAMDGIEAAKILRTQYSLPVIFLTAFATDNVIARAKIAEPYGYIHKPFSERELRTVLEMSLYKKEIDNKLVAESLHNQTILDNMVDGIVTINEHGIIDFFNMAACTIFGYQPEEVCGYHVHMLIPEHRRSQHNDYVPPNVHTNTAQALPSLPRETVALHKNGNVFPIDLSTTQGVCLGKKAYISTVRDITERKANDLELQQHRDHLEKLVEIQTAELRESVNTIQQALLDLEQQKFVLDQHSIVSICNLKGEITYANDRFLEISGYSREELLGQNHSILNSGYHSKAFFKDMYKTISQGKVWQNELCNRTKDGQIYWVDSTIVVFMGANKKPREYIAIRNDITARKRSEEAAATSNLAKSAFLANMSHEIRTPMNGIVGMADILTMTDLNQEQRRMVDIIHNSSLALLNILNDILDYSKVEAGMLAIENIPTNIRKVAENVAKLMFTSSTANTIKLHVFVSPDLPQSIISDPNRLRQVLLNLLGNAIKFTGNHEDRLGRVILRADPCTLADGHPGVQFHIIDNGIGIKPEVLDRLFQPFSQSDVSTARKFGGTGLGLSISKKLIDLMGGSISVSSSFGEGSQFTVELPLQELALGGALPVEQSLAGLHVLAVTHDAAVVESVSAYCIAEGAKVSVAADLAAARQQLQQSRQSPDATVVLLGYDVTTHCDEPDWPAGVSVVRLVQFSSRSNKNEIEIQACPLLYDELIYGVGLASGRFTASDITYQTPYKYQKQSRNVPSVEEAALTGQLILLAEDNETNREVMLEQLRLLGFRAEVATDGLLALEMWRSGRYALLLTDCHMPNMDGFELTASIRKAEPEGTHLPIIAITANAMKGESRHCLESGMDGYLSKPLRLNELERTLAKWLPLAAELTEKIQGQSSDKAAALLLNNLASDEVPEESAAGLPAVWDAAILISLVDGNADMCHRLLKKFLLTSQAQVAAITAAMAESETGIVIDIAHNLKSSARTVGAMRLGELCHNIEAAGRAGDAQTCSTLTECLSEVFANAAEKINQSFQNDEESGLTQIVH